MPRSIWPPSYDLEQGLFCRNNASEISSCLHPPGRIKRTTATKCKANHAYARHSSARWHSGRYVSKGSAGPVVLASSIDRHPYASGFKYFDTANALRPNTATDEQLLTRVRPQQQSVSWGSRGLVGLPQAKSPATGIVLIETWAFAMPISGLCSLPSWAARLNRHGAGDYPRW